jgi:hypothetical protein
MSGGDQLFRVRAGPSSKREWNEYLPSKAPLPSLSVPAPSFRSPRHSASEIRFAIVHSIRMKPRGSVSGVKPERMFDPAFEQGLFVEGDGDVFVGLGHGLSP